MDNDLQNLKKENQRLKIVVNELTFLNDISRTMSSTLSLQEIMAQIINKSIQVTGVEQGTIMLVDENAKTSMKTMIRGVAKTHHGSYLISRPGDQKGNSLTPQCTDDLSWQVARRDQPV
jgi:GAF domain-containing protein